MTSLRIPSLGLLFVIACGGADITLGNNDGGGDAQLDASPNDAAPPDGAPPTDGQAVDSPVTIDASNFDPSTLSGLALWLDANVGITKNNNAVSAWADRTSNHNDASQPTAAVQPMFNGSAINNLPAVHFNKDAQGQSVGGNMMTIADSASLQWGTGDFYLVAVLRYDNNVTNDGPERGEGLFFSKVSSGSSSVAGVFFVGGIPTVFGNGPTNGLLFSTHAIAGDFITSSNLYNNDNAHVFAIQRANKTMDLRVDGASIGTSVSSGFDVSNAGTAVRIGGDANGAAIRLDGDVAEMLAVKGALSQSDRTNLEAWLKGKYAL